jgi:hypothetical protein
MSLKQGMFVTAKAGQLKTNSVQDLKKMRNFNFRKRDFEKSRVFFAENQPHNR